MGGFLFGTLEGIRTPDLPLRRRPLYPTELQAQMLLLLYSFALLFVNAKKGEKEGRNYCNREKGGL